MKFFSNSVDRPIKSFKKMGYQINSHETNVLESLELDLRTEFRLLFTAQHKDKPLDSHFSKLQNEYVQNNDAYQLALEHNKTLERRLQQWERYENGDGPKPHVYAVESTQQNNYDLDTVLSLNDDNKSLLSGFGSNNGSIEVEHQTTKVPPVIQFIDKKNKDPPDSIIDHSIGMVNDSATVKEGNKSVLPPTKEVQEEDGKVSSNVKLKNKNNQDPPDSIIDHSIGMVNDSATVKEGNKSVSTATMAIEIHNGVYMYQDVEIHFRFSKATGLTKTQKRRKKRNDKMLSLKHQDNLLRMGVISQKYVGETVKVFDESKNREYSGSIHCVGSSSGYTYSVIESNAHKVVSSSMPAWRIALIGTDVDLIMNSNRLLDVISRTSDNLYKIPIGRRRGSLEE
jgi:hypothetical protein